MGTAWTDADLISGPAEICGKYWGPGDQRAGSLVIEVKLFGNKKTSRPPIESYYKQVPCHIAWESVLTG